MNESLPIRVLIIEDSPTDVLLVKDLFADVPNVEFLLEHVSSLSDALKLLQRQPFDAILLDLGLPDSQGVDTFVQLHRSVPEIPILVLSGSEDATTTTDALRCGAEDYLIKQKVRAAVLKNSVRFAVLRSEARRTEQEAQRQRELAEVGRLSSGRNTSITARIYSGSPLRENAPDEFKSAVAEYFDLLGLALECRSFQTDDDCAERLRELGLQLGFLRSGPRDVVEIYVSALKRRTQDATALKAQAYLEEGRIMTLELMGHLTSYYRSFYSATKVWDSKL